jgi:hypothetical protein
VLPQQSPPICVTSHAFFGRVFHQKSMHVKNWIFSILKAARFFPTEWFFAMQTQQRKY